VKSDRLPTQVLLIGLVLALAASVVPLYGDQRFWRPPFVLLLVIYWLFREPQRFGLGFAWLMGLLIDFLFGQILGQHALAMSVAAYLVITQQQRLHHFKVLHQCLFVILVVFVYQLVLLVVRLLIDDITTFTPLFYSTVSSSLLWPLLFFGLEKLHGERW
tara:strand:- start:15 stop:494 length:480 start_codon:yes stop_codon:yes gene_type:complete